MRTRLVVCILSLVGLMLIGCEVSDKISSAKTIYPTTKPCTRWWWFATEIKKEDIKHQLDWLQKNNFGGVEIAWVYPLYRYQRMYQRNYNRHYPKDTTAQEWLSPEWTEMVSYAKSYSDSLGLICDFTFGSAWPVAGLDMKKEHTTQVYGDTSFQQLLTFAWTWPDTMSVINHLDKEAFAAFAAPIEDAIKPVLKGSKSALFTDSWEIKMNSKYKVWTNGFEDKFQDQFGYDIIPYMDQGLDSFPDVRYDYMLLIDDYVTEGFYKPYVEKCKELGAWSRVQCLASPTDVMNTYALVDIPETEAMLNNPSFSRVVSSSACLAQKPMVSSESFTCMYGFPSTYLREEQTADLKMVADALFANGVNQHFYHGTPYNPMGSDTIEFFATTYFGPGGSLESELPTFNGYMETVSGYMQRGKTYSDVAVYIPYEDGVMQGAYPEERQRVWVWGEYELRYIAMPEETKGYHPLWINREFLTKADFVDGRLSIGDASFTTLYIDVDYMDERALARVVELAQKGLPVVLKKDPQEPGKNKSDKFNSDLITLKSLTNVSEDFTTVVKHKPLISGETIPDYWSRVEEDGTFYIFLAQPFSKDLLYPVYSGQSYMAEAIDVPLNISVGQHLISKTFTFNPYQSLLLEITPEGTLRELDINYVPKDPVIRPREKQKMYF